MTKTTPVEARERGDEGPFGTRSSFGELVGRTPAMRSLFDQCTRLAGLSTPVLVTGEAGTGKDLLARTLHAESPRRAGPFVVFDCSQSAPAALESELFGRPEGATRGRPGALELARGGSLLLDEVADLPLALQERLHAVLAAEAGSPDPSHARSEPSLDVSLARETAPFDVRLISASKRKLTAEVARGKLRADLHALLAQHELYLPPLRERREDIPLLAQTLLARLPEGRGNALSPEALNVLSLHDWPGNVRELRNLVERFAYALHGSHPGARRLSAMLLNGELSGPVHVDRRPSPAEGPTFEPGSSYRDERARFEAVFEQRYVAWLLERHDGNISAAARAADMDRKYLYKLAKKHGLKASD